MKDNLNEKLEQGYKRLCLVNVVWSLLLMPLAFVFNENDLSMFVLIWMIWIIIGLLLSPKITMRIWRK
jgi:hypothetical protein